MQLLITPHYIHLFAEDETLVSPFLYVCFKILKDQDNREN